MHSKAADVLNYDVSKMHSTDGSLQTADVLNTARAHHVPPGFLEKSGKTESPSSSCCARAVT